MTRAEALKLLTAGPKGIAEWNRRRNFFAEIPGLAGVDLSHVDLSGADLLDVDLLHANLASADLSDVDLTLATLRDCDLTDANLDGARMGLTVIATDLSEVRGLDNVVHGMPSHISTDTLERSEGRIPDVFLRGCGLSPWEILSAKLYDPDLTPPQIEEILRTIFELRTKGPFGRVFISFCHVDVKFVDKIDTRLRDQAVQTYRYDHDAVAGPLERQVFDAIRINDVVLLVLSEASVNSDWVEAELERARKKEKDTGRDVLCPVALDDSWKAKLEQPGSAVLWRQVKAKNVLDFSKWKTKAFSAQFQKLLKGLKIYYTTPPEGPRKS